MIVKITDISEVKGDYGNYIKVKGLDENGKLVTKNVGNKFSDKKHLLVKDARVEFKMSQKDGKWVIDDITSVADSPSPPEEVIGKATQSQEEAYPDTARKIEARETGKNRAFALSYSKDIACAKIQAGKETSVYDVLDVAVLFESYLESGAVIEKKDIKKE